MIDTDSNYKHYREELKSYTAFYDKIRTRSPNDKVVKLAEQGFYNCLAISGKLSFSSDANEFDIRLCLDFIKITEKLMYLTGLDEAPDEMPYIIMAIKEHAIYTHSLSAQSERYCMSGLSEKEYEKIIIEQFDQIKQFKKYKFIGSQVHLPENDRIDILAEDIISRRPVIIELKRGNKSGHKQLRSYATSYDNPILINLSVEQPVSKRKDVIYYLFKDLGVGLECKKENSIIC